jgi:NTE family protein
MKHGKFFWQTMLFNFIETKNNICNGIFVLMKILILLLLPICSFCQPKNIYKNLALEGGGTRGIAFAGAFKVLQDKGILQNIENVAGTSAGAVAGLLISIGYSAAEIDSILMFLPFEKFNDGRGGLIGKYWRLNKRSGIYKGNKFEDWFRMLLQKKTNNADLTFAELHNLKLQDKKYKDLYCTGTNISKQRLEVFSYKNTPNFSIATAVRISGGIPIYFAPIALDDSLKKIKKGDTSSYKNYYVDGGLLCNYPISMFDSCRAGGEPILSTDLVFNKQTLGIKLERKEQVEYFLKNTIEIPSYRVTSSKDYISAFSNLLMESLERKYPGLENEKGRSILIGYGNISATIKKVSVKNKRLLFDNGVTGALQFFELQNKVE